MLKKFYKIIILPYTLFLLYLMFFGMGRFQMEHNVIRIKPILSTIYFIEETFLLKDIFTIVVGNLIMFIPFGFLGWVFPRLKDLKSLTIDFVSVIVIVEALQYFSRLGVFDIDDIILNTFGVYLGFQICKFFETRLARFI